MFTYAVPHLAEASPVGRHKEQYKQRRNKDIGQSIYQGFCDIIVVEEFESTPVSIKNFVSSYSSPSSDEVKNEWSHIPLHSHNFLDCIGITFLSP